MLSGNSIMVLEDEHGIFARVGSKLFRPGPIVGLDEMFPTDDGGLKKRGMTKASAGPAGTMRMHTPQGQRYWSSLPVDHADRIQKVVDKA